MKGKRTLLLLLILVLILAVGSYFLVFKKKKKPAKRKERPAVTQVMATPEVEPTPVAAAPRPAASPQPGMSPGPEASRIKASATPFPAFPLKIPGTPRATPSPMVPRTESLPTETQPLIDVQLGAPLKTAEGTTLVLEQVQVQYAGKNPLKYRWEVAKGPTDSIKIIDPQAQKARILIDNLDQPAEFTLKLTATDGRTEAAGELALTAFPSRLSRVARAGGAWTGVSHMGANWVAARGNQVEIFNPDFQPLAVATAPFPVTQFFAVQGANGKGAIYVQAPEGQWAILQSDPVTGTKVTQAPSVGRTVRRVAPFLLEGQPYVFALLERGVELWNLSEPTHPRLKSSLGNFLKNPLYLTFLGRNLYVADEEGIHLIDFPTGKLVASVPAGGSVTGLGAYTLEDKNYLLASIGIDRTPQGRKDYGLRLFEIAESGVLTSEKRLALQGNPPIRKTLLIPNAGKALFAVEGETGLELRMTGLKPFEEIALEGGDSLSFLNLSEMETGKIKDQAVAVAADGNQLRILEFRAAGEKRYAVTQKDAIPGLLSSAWVGVKPDGAFLWVGDEGIGSGGAVAVLAGTDLKILKAQNAPARRFPVESDFRTGSDEAPVLFVESEVPARGAQPSASKDGLLAFLNTKDPPALNLVRSEPFLGGLAPQGLLRALGVAGRASETGLRLAVALSRLKGNVGGSGLMFWDRPANQAASAFLQGDPAKTANLIPLGDARDVALSKDGKWAFIAGGVDGVIAVDLEKKEPRARMSLGTKDWVADRVVLSEPGNLLLVSFIHPSTRQGILKIFGLTPDLKMQEFGTLTGFSAVNTVEGLRAPVPGLTEDGIYLFHPHSRMRNVSVFNLSNPAQPTKIAELDTEGEVRGIQVANRYKDVFVAMGPAGVAKLEFGF